MPSKRTQALSRSSAAHATAVVLEDVRSQNKVVLEAVQGVGQKVDGLAHRMDRFEHRVDGLEVTIGGLEMKVDALDQKLERVRLDLLERIGRIEDAVRENSREIRALREALAAKADAAELAALEQRVAALERRVMRRGGGGP
jgi:predicted  nucleic acid-binding Zn-ribbon protein